LRLKVQDSVDQEATAWLAELRGVNRDLETARMRLLRIGRQMDRMLASIAQRHGMTLGDWETLSILRRSGRPYTLSPTALAQMLQVTSGTMSVRLERLQRAGLVEHAGDSGDGRGRPMRLTATGTRRWREATAERTTIEKRLLSSALGGGDVRLLNRLLRRLMVIFESELGPPPPRPETDR
jgi:DNA-binding MarR family transcriptional regulator